MFVLFCLSIFFYVLWAKLPEIKLMMMMMIISNAEFLETRQYIHSVVFQQSSAMTMSCLGFRLLVLAYKKLKHKAHTHITDKLLFSRLTCVYDSCAKV